MIASLLQQEPNWRETQHATLLGPVQQVPAPPCDGCAHRQACAGERLACGDFLTYIVSKSSQPDDWNGLLQDADDAARRTYAESSRRRTPDAEGYELVFATGRYKHLTSRSGSVHSCYITAWMSTQAARAERAARA